MSKIRKLSSAELNQFDGQDGRPLYVVFKGKVYDFTTSKLWPQGKHFGIHTRGENLTESIKAAPHGEENVLRFPLVGEIEETALPPLTQPTPLEKRVAEPQAQLPLQPQAISRRNFLKLAAAAGGAITVVAVASSIKAATFVPTSTTPTSWPVVTVANINQVQPLTPNTFYYPLTSTPNVLVKLGVAAEGGIGPQNDIVAFSIICQHLGCQYGFVPTGSSPICNAAYKATQPMGYCCCHGSQYDFTKSGKVLGGPAPRPVPMVQLQLDLANGDIEAVGMTAPTIYGHGPPGTTDPTLVMQYDLTGGTVVTQTTVNVQG